MELCLGTSWDVNSERLLELNMKHGSLDDTLPETNMAR